MKTCKDCISYDMCETILMTRGSLDDGFPNCKFFKDKSKFIEKPFDIGDQIYIITKYGYSNPYEIIKCIVTKMRLKDGSTITFSCSGRYANNGWYSSGNFKTSSIGKTVFLTQEEAEKKLGEVNGNN